jgi:hypothetical protein
MRYEILPEPTPVEREALARGLAAADEGRAASVSESAWWEAGIREAVEGDRDTGELPE